MNAAGLLLAPVLAMMAAAAAPAGAAPAAAAAAGPARAVTAGPQVVLRPDRIVLVEPGGQATTTMPFDGRDTTLRRVAEAVARSRHPDWVAEGRRGVFLLRSTLVQAPGTRLLVAAPDVRQVRLAAPGGGIRARGASATFEGVRVTSWDPARRGPIREPSAPRPAIVYGDGASLRLVRAELAWLGTRRPGSDTGVTWAGSSGAAVDSRFHHNAAGAEVLRGARVAVIRSAFEDNAGHGLMVEGAGAAPAVERSVVRRNGGDGIVLLGVDGLLLWGNTVGRNRVGIRVGRRSVGARIETNLLDRNRRGIEVYDGARDTALAGNVITRSAEAGIVLEGAATSSRDDQVHDTPVAVEVRGLAQLDAPAVIGSARGIVVAARGIARIERAQVVASLVALEVSPGSVVRLQGSRLRAAEPIAGGALVEATGNDLGDPRTPPPLPWLALAGIAFLFIAVLLQIVHRTRNRLLASKGGPSRCFAGPR